MAYSVKKNWISSFGFILAKPTVLLPFIIIAFFEGLAMELLYFSTRKPLSIVAGPIIRKYFGENSLHYPVNLLILPDLFYYIEITIYVFVSVFLMAISINMVKNVKMNLPVKIPVLIKNASKQYSSYIIFGIIMIISIILLRGALTSIFANLTQFISKHFSNIGTSSLYLIGLLSVLFIANCVLQVFLLLTIPLMVIERKPLLKALGGGIYLGFRNFFSLFSLIFLPFLLYFPITLLKIGSARLANKTFPEVILCVMVAGIIIGVLIDCFVFVCASQFLLDKGEAKK